MDTKSNNIIIGLNSSLIPRLSVHGTNYTCRSSPSMRNDTKSVHLQHKHTLQIVAYSAITRFNLVKEPTYPYWRLW